MSGRWWRAYSRARHDPKLLKLSDKHFRWWFSFVCVASDNDGVLPLCADLAVEFRTSEKVITAALDVLVGAGLFDHDETGIHPHNWNGLQYTSDSPNDRVKKYRDKRRASGLPILGDYTKFKAALIARDGDRCIYCEATDKLVVDHMVPIAMGGTDAEDNLALACKPCNSGKAGRTPELANMTIRVTTATEALARYRDNQRDVTVSVTPSETEADTETESEQNREDTDRAFALFNDAAKRTGWPAAQKIDETRKRKMVARLREVGGLEGFGVAIAKAEASEFLTVTWPNFNIDWLLKPANFTKLMEGNYDKQSGAARTGISADFATAAAALRGKQYHGL
jgi:5-methylcytosine-specific restriction endonuclease McrA